MPETEKTQVLRESTIVEKKPDIAEPRHNELSIIANRISLVINPNIRKPLPNEVISTSSEICCVGVRRHLVNELADEVSDVHFTLFGITIQYVVEWAS